MSNSRLNNVDKYCITNMIGKENKTIQEVSNFINKPVKTIQNFLDKNPIQKKTDQIKNETFFVKKTVSQKDGVNIMTEAQSSKGDNKKAGTPKRFDKSIHKIASNEQE